MPEAASVVVEEVALLGEVEVDLEEQLPVVGMLEVGHPWQPVLQNVLQRGGLQGVSHLCCPIAAIMLTRSSTHIRSERWTNTSLEVWRRYHRRKNPSM